MSMEIVERGVAVLYFDEDQSPVASQFAKSRLGWPVNGDHVEAPVPILEFDIADVVVRAPRDRAEIVVPYSELLKLSLGVAPGGGRPAVDRSLEHGGHFQPRGKISRLANNAIRKRNLFSAGEVLRVEGHDVFAGGFTGLPHPHQVAATVVDVDGVAP